jgi:hypothetical protein
MNLCSSAFHNATCDAVVPSVGPRNTRGSLFLSSFSDQPSPLADLDYPSALLPTDLIDLMQNDIPDRGAVSAGLLILGPGECSSFASKAELASHLVDPMTFLSLDSASPVGYKPSGYNAVPDDDVCGTSASEAFFFARR